MVLETVNDKFLTSMHITPTDDDDAAGKSIVENVISIHRNF